MARSGYRLLGLFAAASVCFGGTFVAAKVGLADLPPLLFVALRFDVGAVLLAVYVAATYPRERWLPHTRGDVAGVLAAGVFAIGLTNAFVFIGQQHVTSGVASVLYSLNPILTPAFAAGLLADEALSRGDAVGVALGFVGVALVVGVDPATLLGGGLAGKVAVVAAAGSGAFGGVLVRRADSPMPNAVRTAWAVPAAALLCHLASVGAGEEPSAAAWTLPALAALGFVGVCSTAVAFVAYFGLLDEVGPIRANLVFYAVPAVATLGGWALLGETVSPSTLAGFAVIAAGFAVVVREPLAAELSRLRSVVGREAEWVRSH